MRQTHFSGNIVENTTSPRLEPPRECQNKLGVSRLQFVSAQNLGFIPLHGERDEESQFGVPIPYKGWILDVDSFGTRAKNYFDHNNIGNSHIFFPLTIEGAFIRGWELTLRSPKIAKLGQLYVTYSNQVAQGKGAINDGLTDFSPPGGGYFLLDHDRRNTLQVGR